MYRIGSVTDVWVDRGGPKRERPHLLAKLWSPGMPNMDRFLVLIWHNLSFYSYEQGFDSQLVMCRDSSADEEACDFFPLPLPLWFVINTLALPIITHMYSHSNFDTSAPTKSDSLSVPTWCHRFLYTLYCCSWQTPSIWRHFLTDALQTAFLVFQASPASLLNSYPWPLNPQSPSYVPLPGIHYFLNGTTYL